MLAILIKEDPWAVLYMHLGSDWVWLSIQCCVYGTLVLISSYTVCFLDFACIAFVRGYIWLCQEK